MWAAESGYIDIIKAILSSQHCSKNVLNQIDYRGRNALMRAAEKDHIDIVKAILASQNCSEKVLNQTDIGGNNASQLAEKWGHNAIGEILKDPIKNKFKEHQLIVDLLNRLQKGAKSKNPYWRNSSKKLERISKALSNISVDKLPEVLKNKDSELSKAIDSRRWPSFFSAFRKIAPTVSRDKVSHFHQPKQKP